MVIGWVVFTGLLLLGSVSALPFIWWGGVFCPSISVSDIAFVFFVPCLLCFRCVFLSGTKPVGHLEGAEVVPWLGWELVPLWPLPEQG